MTGKGYDAFVKGAALMWLVGIVLVVALIAMLIFAPWLLPVLLLVAGVFIWIERQKNLKPPVN